MVMLLVSSGCTGHDKSRISKGILHFYSTSNFFKHPLDGPPQGLFCLQESQYLFFTLLY